MSAATRLLPGSGRLIVVSGPSGVGKDTVLQRVFELDPSLRRSVSYTTRPRRSGERDGDAYTFVDEPAFRAMIDRDEFLEWANVYGHLYGTPLLPVRRSVAGGECIVLKIDVQGAQRVRERAGDEATFIFILPPSVEELHRRLVDRATEDGTELQLRFDNAVRELALQDTYDHRVVNDDVDRAAGRIVEIVSPRRRDTAEPARG